jgi:hypothetical protein
MVSIILMVLVVLGGVLAAYILLHYVLFLLASHPKDAAKIGHELNQFERRQLVEWAPKPEDFLKHDDEHRSYDDVFGPYRSEHDNYSTCVFPRAPFTQRYASDYLLLNPKDGMRLLDLGCGSGAAADVGLRAALQWLDRFASCSGTRALGVLRKRLTKSTPPALLAEGQGAGPTQGRPHP